MQRGATRAPAVLERAAEAGDRTRFALLAGRLEAARIVAAVELRSADRGHAWTQGQRDATKGPLLSTAAVTGVQGRAGTAKTTTVLTTLADAARDQGLAVRALAPTATAADVLGRAIGAEPMTVAKMLAGPGEDVERSSEVWMVDEAGMAGARDMDALVALATDAGARLVLVGDVAQLGNVEAGRAFGQFQDHGMASFVLDVIVRETNRHTREAVEHMLAGDAKAFAALDAGGGRVVKQPDSPARQAVLARDFVALTHEEREKTLVLDPTRECLRQLTACIRASLVRDGTLGKEALVVTVLDGRHVEALINEQPLGVDLTAQPLCEEAARSVSEHALVDAVEEKIAKLETAIGVHVLDDVIMGCRSPAGCDGGMILMEADPIDAVAANFRIREFEGAVARTATLDPAAATLGPKLAEARPQHIDGVVERNSGAAHVVGARREAKRRDAANRHVVGRALERRGVVHIARSNKLVR